MNQKHITSVDFSTRGQIMKARRHAGKEKKKFKKAPVWRYPTSAEVQYRVFLQRIVSYLRKKTVDALSPQLSFLIGEADRERKTDGWADDLQKVMNTLSISFDAEIEDDAVPSFLQRLSGKINSWNTNQRNQMVRTVMGIDHFAYEPWAASHMKSFVSENVGLISKLKDETFGNINRIVESGLRNGDLQKTIMRNILDGTDLEAGTFSKVEDRARLIARDQVGKFNGELTEIRQKAIGVNEYYWRTTGDERVRDSHDALDGMLCKYSDDTVFSDDAGVTWQSRKSIEAFEGTPGEDYQCRCWPEAVFTDTTNEEEEE